MNNYYDTEDDDFFDSPRHKNFFRFICLVVASVLFLSLLILYLCLNHYVNERKSGDNTSVSAEYLLISDDREEV